MYPTYRWLVIWLSHAASHFLIWLFWCTSKLTPWRRRWQSGPWKFQMRPFVQQHSYLRGFSGRYHEARKIPHHVQLLNREETWSKKWRMLKTNGQFLVKVVAIDAQFLVILVKLSKWYSGKTSECVSKWSFLTVFSSHVQHQKHVIWDIPPFSDKAHVPSFSG